MHHICTRIRSRREKGLLCPVTWMYTAASQHRHPRTTFPVFFCVQTGGNLTNKNTTTGIARDVPPTNWPFRAHYADPPMGPLSAGEAKVLARQGLLRKEFSGMLCNEPALKGLTPSLSGMPVWCIHHPVSFPGEHAITKHPEFSA